MTATETARTPRQSALCFEGTPERPCPPASDPHLVEALRRIHQRQNGVMLARLLRGPIGSDELERHDQGWGKRGSARLYDVAEWLRALGYDGDPLERTCLDARRGIWTWALTPAAAEMARGAAR